MECQWLKTTQSLTKGVTVINSLDGEKFQQFLRRIVTKLKLQDTELFTEDERQKLLQIFKVDEESLILAIKTICYIFKKMLKYIFMPSDLKVDLKVIGFNNEKADYFVKLWSSEIRETLDELGKNVTNDSNDALHFEWKLNAELSSNYHKKCKVPKTYLSFSSNTTNLELELGHPEVYSMYLQFEAIQKELDNFI